MCRRRRVQDGGSRGREQDECATIKFGGGGERLGGFADLIHVLLYGGCGVSASPESSSLFS